jgi:hypothetical protein
MMPPVLRLISGGRMDNECKAVGGMRISKGT